jgi:hypothetical protein
VTKAEVMSAGSTYSESAVCCDELPGSKLCNAPLLQACHLLVRGSREWAIIEMKGMIDPLNGNKKLILHLDAGSPFFKFVAAVTSFNTVFPIDLRHGDDSLRLFSVRKRHPCPVLTSSRYC